jgi:hypothetical protein
MRALLRDSNLDLIGELERLDAVLSHATVAPELAPYRGRLVSACAGLYQQALRNLADLELQLDQVLPVILSETQRLARDLRLYNIMAGPVLRSIGSDRLSLLVINWLHASHKKTADIAAAVSTQEFGIWPDPPHPVVYFLPTSAQQGLLYQPFFFHEFGHLLYACHKLEMDDLVRDLQEEIGELLQPLARRDDVQGRTRLEERAVVVATWYKWTQELFSDAVGLAIGGPAFIHSFNRYLRMSARTEYLCPRHKLALRPHPPTWLRARLLARRAREVDCEDLAQVTDRQWAAIASTLGVAEDYYGFYEEGYVPAIWQCIEDMLIEAAPYRFTNRDLGLEPWSPDSTPVHLANCAWREFLRSRDTYSEFERRVVSELCA